ncbi:hypothetical protein BC831DRAFT_455125 [Entophlyctis helioformis]|nr:hypothetical protein BC831DRAFT_455125 [Entophlyctis helioformis]
MLWLLLAVVVVVGWAQGPLWRMKREGKLTRRIGGTVVAVVAVAAAVAALSGQTDPQGRAGRQRHQNQEHHGHPGHQHRRQRRPTARESRTPRSALATMAWASGVGQPIGRLRLRRAEGQRRTACTIGARAPV